MSTSLSNFPNLHKKRKISTSKVNKNLHSNQKYPPICEESKKHIANSKKSVRQNTDQQSWKSEMKKLYNLNDKLFFQALEENQLKQANNLLNDIRYLIESINCGTNKKFIYSNLSIYHVNKAYILHLLNDNQGSCLEMANAIQKLQYVQGYITNRQENLTHMVQFIKLNFQYFTCLSNISRHLDAVVAAQKCLQKIKEAICVLEALCNQSNLISGTPQTVATESESRVKSERVDFKRIVVKEAQKLLHSIQILQPHKLITQNKQLFEQRMNKMYFWQNNLENNVKTVQKQFRNKQKERNLAGRNLLGVQKQSNFTQEFSLGELMSLKPKKIKTKLNSDKFYLLSSPKIVELILFASVCYFTIATQLRFKEIDTDINSLKIAEKYQKLNKDEKITKCKILHFKAIELAAKYLPINNCYFIHILNSFNKNYKSLLDEINEQQSQSSLHSYNKSLEKYKEKFQQENQNTFPQQYGISNVHSQNLLHSSSKTTKRLQIVQKQKQKNSEKIKPQKQRKRTNSKDKQLLSKRKKSTQKRPV